MGDESNLADVLDVGELEGVFSVFNVETDDEYATFETQDEAQEFLDWLVAEERDPRGLSEEELAKLLETYDAECAAAEGTDDAADEGDEGDEVGDEDEGGEEGSDGDG